MPSDPGAFVPMFDPPRNGSRSSNVGWIVAENGCHIWQGQRSWNGYGRVWFGGRLLRVHRVRYEREVGPIPDGMVLDHFVCASRACCNPHHVRPVTRRENNLRGDTIAAAGASKTHCPRGHPYSGDNLYVVPSRGHRQCRMCLRAKERRRPPRLHRAQKKEKPDV